MEETKERATKKASRLLALHEADLIKELGPSAFEVFPPRKAAEVLGIDVTRLTDLTRQGWLEKAPGYDIGPAHQYYRWRVEFIKRYKQTYGGKSKDK